MPRLLPLLLISTLFAGLVSAPSDATATLLQPGQVGIFIDENATDRSVSPGAGFSFQYVVARLDPLGISRLRFRLVDAETGAAPLVASGFPDGITDLDPEPDRFDLVIDSPVVREDGLVTLVNLVFIISTPRLRMVPLDAGDPAPMVTSRAPGAQERPIDWRTPNWQSRFTYTITEIPPTLIVWQVIDLWTPTLGSDAGGVVTIDWFADIMAMRSSNPDNVNQRITWNVEDEPYPYCGTIDGDGATACFPVRWIEGRLEWDSPTATLLDLRLGPVVTDWTLTILDQGPGFVDVRIEGDPVYAFDRKVLELDLQLPTTDSTVRVWASDTANSVPIHGSFSASRPATILIGCESYDVVDDDVVDEADVLRTQAMLLGATTFDDDELCRADVDRDGSLDAVDLLRIHRRAQGFELGEPLGGTASVSFVAGDDVGLLIAGATAGDIVLEGNLDPDAVVSVTSNADRAAAHVRPDGRLSVVFVNEDAAPTSLTFTVSDGTAPALGIRDLDLYDADGTKLDVDTATAVDPNLRSPLVIGAPHPNPFNPRVSIPFRATTNGWFDVEILDVRGRRVHDLGRRHHDAGAGSVVWNGTDDGGRPVSSGVYFVSIRTADRAELRRVVLVR